VTEHGNRTKRVQIINLDVERPATGHPSSHPCAVPFV
jgi:hypothetical protein